MVPDEELPYLRSIFNINLIGVHRWDQIFSSRQLLSLLTLAQLVRTYYSMNVTHDGELATAVATALALAVDRQADYTSSICTWVQSGEFVGHTFAQGQSLPIKWDFAEVVPCASGSGNWDGAIGWVTRVLQEVAAAQSLPGHVQKASSTEQPLPDDAAQLIFTDPPNAAKPQPRRTSAPTTNTPRFAVTDVILSAVHPALKAHSSRPLVHFSGSYECRPSA